MRNRTTVNNDNSNNNDKEALYMNILTALKRLLLAKL
jgi:hypothetical protein